MWRITPRDSLTDMAVRLARTNAEEHLFMQLEPCLSCGATGFDAPGGVILVDGVLASRFTGSCTACGQPREFVFRLPEQILVPEPDQVRFGPDGEASELIDAGEWLLVAEQSARGVPASVDGLDEAGRAAARTALATVLAAMDEVLKFIPDDADAVPEQACWTTRGRLRYATEPGRFRRVRLVVRRAAYQDLFNRLAG